jgi:uncharacterized membrane protein
MRWFFTSPAPIDHAAVVAAIKAAEANTTGEIRVVLARNQAKHPVVSAEKHFYRLGMDKTLLRNGVMIFLAPRSRNFAVIGDKGIHEKCGEVFWTELAAAMTGYFKRGVVHGIERAGALLAEHFPRTETDAGNELPDDVEEVD